jgi:nitrogen fixation/metabolism regulation signal transduction histidine kinase
MSPPRTPLTGLPLTGLPQSRRLNFEARVLLMALLVATPALVALVVVLWANGAGRGVWLTVLLPIAALTLGLAAWLRRRVVFPLYTLSNLLEALREGDFSLRGTRARRGDAIGEVVWEVNALSETLRQQRLRVEETLALLTKVMAAVDIAIVAFDADQRLRLINPAGERLLLKTSAQAQGLSAGELGLADCLEIEHALTVKRAFPGGAGAFDIRHAVFREGGVRNDLLAITDLSRALREEERRAWQRLIRVLGHELNNSLAPIKSMAATLADLVGRDQPPADWRDDARSGLSVIADRADALARFMAGYTALAKLPPPRKRAVDLADLLTRVRTLETRVPVHLGALASVSVPADPDQLEQALINLVRNAAEASAGNGGSVTLRGLRSGAQVVIEIEDDGPGLSGTENLFVPFFTTKPGGSGIGLVLARQIVEAHGGALSLRNRSTGSGCVARVTLPLQPVGPGVS